MFDHGIVSSLILLKSLTFFIDVQAILIDEAIARSETSQVVQGSLLYFIRSPSRSVYGEHPRIGSRRSSVETELPPSGDSSRHGKGGSAEVTDSTERSPAEIQVDEMQGVSAHQDVAIEKQQAFDVRRQVSIQEEKRVGGASDIEHSLDCRGRQSRDEVVVEFVPLQAHVLCRGLTDSLLGFGIQSDTKHMDSHGLARFESLAERGDCNGGRHCVVGVEPHEHVELAHLPLLAHTTGLPNVCLVINLRTRAWLLARRRQQLR